VYLKHEAYQCKNGGLPEDILHFPDNKEGRKPCPGCGRTFAGPNVAYLRHLRTCPRVRFGGFICDLCSLSFSTERTFKRHRRLCESSRKGLRPTAAADKAPGPQNQQRKRVGDRQAIPIIPQLIKRTKSELDPLFQESNVSVELLPNGSRSSPSSVRTPNHARQTTSPATDPLALIPPRARGRNVNGSSSKATKHQVFCKLGNYFCPLCHAHFRLNQPYGKHVKNQECLRGRGETVKAPRPANFTLLYITIHPGTKGDDTIIAYNTVKMKEVLLRIVILV